MQFSHARSNAEPLVSIIMTAHNEERYIGAAIKSIQHQIYQRWELIVVDDDSTDGTADVVSAIHDPRISLVRNQSEERGRAAARNVGFGLVRGEYLAYQDADDVSETTRIEREMQVALTDPGHLAVGCRVVEEIGMHTRVRPLPVEHEGIMQGFDRMTRRGTFVSATLLWPMAVARHFRHRPRFRYMEDWDFLCRIAESGMVRFYNLPEPLYRYVLRAKGTKMQKDWADYNIFVRACQSRRKAALPEWGNLDEFHAYLSHAWFSRLKWGAIRRAVGWKARLEMYRLRATQC